MGTDSATGRIRAFLDARAGRDEPSRTVLTEVDPDPTRGRWLHLTDADLHAVLDEHEQMAATIERQRADNRDLHRRLLEERGDGDAY